MSVSNLPSRLDGKPIDETWWNILQAVFAEQLVPRNTSGVPTNEAGDLGTSTEKFLKLFVTAGGLSAGDTKWKYNYNGAAPIEQGWMLCDGRQITEAEYDTEHGAGSWDTYIASSPLENLYLPDTDAGANGCFLVGTDLDTHDGSTNAYPELGPADNIVSLTHDHPNGTAAVGSVPAINVGTNDTTHARDPDSHSHAVPIASTSLSMNVAPNAIQFRLYMRII